MENIDYRFEKIEITGIQSKRGKVGKKKHFNGFLLKIKAECNADFIKKLSYDVPPDYDKFYFDSDGAVKAHCIDVFTIVRTVEDHKMTIEIEDTYAALNFTDINIFNFTVSPVIGFEYVIKFSLLIEPSEDQLIFIQRAIQSEDIILTIQAPEKMDFS